MSMGYMFKGEGGWKNESNSADKIRQPRTVAYSAELVLVNRQQIWGDEACLHTHQNEKM